MDEIVFATTTQIMEAFGKLFGAPRVIDLPANEEGLKAWIEYHECGDPLEAVRAWAKEHRVRHRKDRTR